MKIRGHSTGFEYFLIKVKGVSRHLLTDLFWSGAVVEIGHGMFLVAGFRSARAQFKVMEQQKLRLGPRTFCQNMTGCCPNSVL